MVDWPWCEDTGAELMALFAVGGESPRVGRLAHPSRPIPFAPATASLHRRRVALADVGLGDEVNARVAGAALSVPPYL